MGKRDDILEAALQLINEDGLQSVTFAKIFSRANVGSSTFYHYFANKEQLVNELFNNIRIRQGLAVMEGYDPNQTVYERVKTMLLNTAQYALSFPEEMQFLDNYRYSPYIAEEIRNFVDPSVIETFAIIGEGQRQGLIRGMEKVLLCQLLYGMITSVTKGYLVGEYQLDDEKLQQIVEVCWKAIKI